MLEIVLEYYDQGSQAISKGVPLVKIRRLSVVQDIARIRFNVANDKVGDIDKLSLKLTRSIAELESLYDER